ncbi:hypothetical protein N9H93_03405 [Rhizobiaceae bacterium]|nr:hypothetical protein [Rhizobiaceae bacterium]
MANAKTKKDETITAADVRDEATTVASKVSNGAREFVRRSAITAQERTDNAFETATSLNDNVEGYAVRAVKGYMNFLGAVAKAAHEDTTRYFTTVEKVASAGSLSEAVRIQSDYVRAATNVNIERAKFVAGEARDLAMDGVSTVRETAMSVMPSRKAA